MEIRKSINSSAAKDGRIGWLKKAILRFGELKIIKIIPFLAISPRDLIPFAIAVLPSVLVFLVVVAVIVDQPNVLALIMFLLCTTCSILHEELNLWKLI